MSSPDLPPQRTMFGRNLPPSLELDSNSEYNQSSETQSETGTESGSSLRSETSTEFQARYEFKVIGLSEQSAQITLSQLEWSEVLRYFGVGVELVSQGLLGKPRAWTLTLKTLDQNSGAVTVITEMLSSMSLEEVSVAD